MVYVILVPANDVKRISASAISQGSHHVSVVIGNIKSVRGGGCETGSARLQRIHGSSFIHKQTLPREIRHTRDGIHGNGAAEHSAIGIVRKSQRDRIRGVRHQLIIPIPDLHNGRYRKRLSDDLVSRTGCKDKVGGYRHAAFRIRRTISSPAGVDRGVACGRPQKEKNGHKPANTLVTGIFFMEKGKKTHGAVLAQRPP